MPSPKNTYKSLRHNRAKKQTPKAAAAAEAAAKKASKESASTKPTMNINKTNVTEADENDVPCNLCTSMVTKDDNNPVRCDSCDKWCHIECTDLNIDAYNFLEKSVSSHPGIKWFCSKCTAAADVCPTNLEDRATRQDAKIDKLGSMFEEMQKKMDSVLTQFSNVSNEKKLEVDTQLSVHVSEVLTNHREIDEKKCNMMVFNFTEGKSINEDIVKLKEMLSYVNKNVDISYLDQSNCTRLGKVSTDPNPRPRPLKIVFHDADMKWNFIKCASRLSGNDSFKKVGLSLDKTTKERKDDMALRELLKVEKSKRPDDDLVIFRRCIEKRGDIDSIKRKEKQPSGIGIPTTAGGGLTPGH